MAQDCFATESSRESSGSARKSQRYRSSARPVGEITLALALGKTGGTETLPDRPNRNGINHLRRLDMPPHRRLEPLFMQEDGKQRASPSTTNRPPNSSRPFAPIFPSLHSPDLGVANFQSRLNDVTLCSGMLSMPTNSVPEDGHVTVGRLPPAAGCFSKTVAGAASIAERIDPPSS